jgi:hypothetical protein
MFDASSEARRTKCFQKDAESFWLLDRRIGTQFANIELSFREAVESALVAFAIFLVLTRQITKVPRKQKEPST